LPDAGEVEVILCRPGAALATAARMTRAAATVARSLGRSRALPVLAGISVEHAGAVVRAAASTLAALEERGWRSIVDQPLGIDGARLAGDAVAERTERFDPLAVLERGAAV